MKSQLKKMYFYMEHLFNTIVSIISVVLFSSFTPYKKIKKISKNRGNNSAILIANGNSLKDILEKQQDKLKDKDLMVLNYFANTAYFPILRPKYYILTDPDMFNPQNITDQIKEMIDNMSKVSWEMILFLPYGAKVEAFDSLKKNEKINVTFYNVTRVVGFKWIERLLWKYDLGVPSSINVSVSGLQLLINMGYERIYLYGVEFSWTKYIDVNPVNNKAFVNDRHFYSEEEIIYYDKGGYKTCLECIVHVLGAMEKLEDYSRYRNVKVINKTRGSFIDAFEYDNE